MEKLAKGDVTLASTGRGASSEPNDKVKDELYEEYLIDLYFSLSKEKRNDRFVSTSDAADIVGISQRTVQDWISWGKIAAVKVGKKYLVDIESLRLYIKSQSQY